ncbi:hypothetical protein [uncultured Nostoc sp.]|uniref:hypothetical protein n=1 Tax=uncultured Nostoc sp. TaxID=340711 RepID=UPI0035CAF429
MENEQPAAIVHNLKIKPSIQHSREPPQPTAQTSSVVPPQTLPSAPNAHHL